MATFQIPIERACGKKEMVTISRFGLTLEQSKAESEKTCVNCDCGRAEQQEQQRQAEIANQEEQAQQGHTEADE